MQQDHLTLNSGVEIPQIGLGTWRMTTDEVATTIPQALEIGYRHIDTASRYGNEQAIGEALAQTTVARSELFITTKLWNDEHNDPERALDESLARLGLEYVDLYLMHWPVPERLASWRVMERLQQSGKARAIGVSNFTPRHLNELLAQAEVVPAVNQIEFNPFLYQQDVLALCKEQGIVVEAYCPLAHGEKLADPVVVAIAERLSVSPAQVLIRWSVQHGLVVLPKSRQAERLAENLNVWNFELSPADMQQLDGLNEDFRVCPDPNKLP